MVQSRTPLQKTGICASVRVSPTKAYLNIVGYVYGWTEKRKWLITHTNIPVDIHSWLIAKYPTTNCHITHQATMLLRSQTWDYCELNMSSQRFPDKQICLDKLKSIGHLLKLSWMCEHKTIWDIQSILHVITTNGSFLCNPLILHLGSYFTPIFLSIALPFHGITQNNYNSLHTKAYIHVYDSFAEAIS